MEFATEMIVRSSLASAKIAEVPITLHPDGRKAHAPHLRTFRDGWRTLRFFLLYSPRWLFLIPGLVLVVAGLIGYMLAMPGVELFGVKFDAHTLLFASLAIICGYQSILFALFTKLFAIDEGLLPPDPRIERFTEHRVAGEGSSSAAGWSLCSGSSLLAGGRAEVARGRFRRARLREHDAGRRARRDRRRRRVPDRVGCFFTGVYGLRRRRAHSSASRYRRVRPVRRELPRRARRGLSLSGEDSELLRRRSVAVLGQRLATSASTPETVLDFGCGTGSTTPLLLDLPGVESVIGTDASAASLDVARTRPRWPAATFRSLDEVSTATSTSPTATACSTTSRRAIAPRPFATLPGRFRPGGVFALWENNPWNPGTRLVMRASRSTGTPYRSRRRPAGACCAESGFEVVRTEFAFIFPHALRALRPVERYANRLPLGGQYMVLARPPRTPA